ncbi:hypothetical protein PQJ75_06180 [Rhodoplanes sp. TEM]|uniref:CMP/dCMP-type deaminase domain-containing protein n=1 Tax=Rhodoplanes tepidamans TaxID=200616 RepID=A0ABT5J7N7_RHOTP|nr:MULTISPECIES: hypothetical protein [Rhodoplanes]MDC7785672.1 hypothetical protein [Rhodoplanes tepidamans]MDC7983313.1 hypothetical protein [Rhodoplanes sp. TEM]MDQ0354761.1 hypothetical protein [Rhodoplanes tepidamans]
MATSPDLASQILRYKSLVAAERVLLGLAELLPPGPRQRAEWLRIKSNLAFRRFQLALVEYVAGEQKAGYNPEQPRVPAGNPDGGQWTRVAGPYSGRGPTRLGANFPGSTYGQQIRLDQAMSRAQSAIAQVRRLDPTWQPSTQSLSSPGSIEAAIRHADARATEAEARYEQLRSGMGGNFGPPLGQTEAQVSSPRSFDPGAWIDVYRSVNNMPNLFGQSAWPLDRGTVAVAEVNGLLYFGTNSGAPTCTRVDETAAIRMRDMLITTYPKIMSSAQIGQIPNNSLFHAEATILLRASRDFSGSLDETAIQVFVDRDLCFSCRRALPVLGLELGNPRVTYVERSSGRRSEMWNGRWLTWRE